MIRFLLLLLAFTAPVSAQTVTFKPSAQDFPNPERGFYRASGEPLDRLDQAWFERVFAEGGRLAYARMDLSAYRATPLPAAYLAALARGFATARASGVKLIVRATYNYPRGETGYQDAQDAPLPIVLGQIAQMKPLFAANADAIAFVQAGFIGAWGEWHTSSNNLTTPENRARIRDALLEAVPAGRFVQFRYPPDLIAWTPSPLPQGLRTGFHNDCFLASQTDVGTFPEDSAARDRMRSQIGAVTAVAPFGGETCNPADDPGATPRTSCADILREGAAFHLTYLNADYYRGLFQDRWDREGCMGEVRRRMGYRLVFEAAMIGPAVRGAPWSGAISIRNEGWARVSNARGLEIVLLAPGGRAWRMPVAADARAWLPGTTTRVSFSQVLPADLPPGTYEVAVAMPDSASALRGDARYAVRPANDNDRERGQRWDSALGAFRTGLLIRVAPSEPPQAAGAVKPRAPTRQGRVG